MMQSVEEKLGREAWEKHLEVEVRTYYLSGSMSEAFRKTKDDAILELS